MSSMIMKIGMNAMKQKLQEKKLDINWEDYNYPPGLRIIHFKPEELQDARKEMLAKFCHVTFLCVVLFYVVNTTSTTLDFLVGDGQFFMMLYSIMHACIALPLALLFMSKGFRCLAGITTETTWYKYGEIFFMAVSAMAFFFKFLCYHGMKYVFHKMKDDGILVFVLGLLELTLLATNFLLRVICAYHILIKYAPKDE